MTRTELRDRILIQLADDTTRPMFWTTGRIDAFIDEAREVVAEEVRQYRKTVVVPKRDGTALYSLHALEPNAMAPYRVWDMDRETALRAVTMKQLDLSRQRWRTVTNDAPECWYPIGWGQFGVYPATATGGGLFQMDFLCWPEALEDDTQELPEPEPDQDASVLYGVYMGLMQQWDVQRATERFLHFVVGWRDSQARNDMRRMQSRKWHREARNVHRSA